MPLYGPVQQQQQQPSPPPPSTGSRKRVALLVVASVLTILFVVLGILLQGWSGAVSLVLSGLSVLLALVPLLVPLPGSPPLVTPKSKSTDQATQRNAEEYELLRKQLEGTHKGTGYGALIIYTTKHLVRCEVRVTSSRENSSTYIAEQTINYQIIYVGTLEYLIPDVYQVTILTADREIYKTAIVVQLGQVTNLYLLNKWWNYLHGYPIWPLITPPPGIRL